MFNEVIEFNFWTYRSNMSCNLHANDIELNRYFFKVFSFKKIVMSMK